MAAAALCALWAVAVHPSLRVASSPTLERAALTRIRAVASAPPTLLEAELEAALASRPRVVRSELDPWREYDPLRAGIDRREQYHGGRRTRGPHRRSGARPRRSTS